MKAITLTQPWATLVAIGAKTIETRDWGTRHRGRIAIHAAKKFPRDAAFLCPTEPFNDTLGAEVLHTGKIVAVASLIACWRFDTTTERAIRVRSSNGHLPKHEADFGDYSPNRWGFVLRDVHRLAEPIPFKGALGLWNLPDEVLAGLAA